VKNLGRTAVAALVLVALIAVPSAVAGAGDPYTLILRGGDGPNEITVGLDGETDEYVIRANGTIGPAETCYNPPGHTNELRCPREDLVGLTVRAGGGNDTIIVKGSVPISTILNGGAGLDDLVGGANTDRIVGGDDDDLLIGRTGSDFLYGGLGDDELRGGGGKDLLRGGAGKDVLRGGPGRDDERQ
jgi:Ca2+-binding RTX toxin-like protein